MTTSADLRAAARRKAMAKRQKSMLVYDPGAGSPALELAVWSKPITSLRRRQFVSGRTYRVVNTLDRALNGGAIIVYEPVKAGGPRRVYGADSGYLGTFVGLYRL